VYIHLLDLNQKWQAGQGRIRKMKNLFDFSDKSSGTIVVPEWCRPDLKNTYMIFCFAGYLIPIGKN
jgi:hypothetical protein